MTPREIFLRALHREHSDRPAVGSATSVATADLMAHVGAAFPEAHFDAETMARLAEAGASVLGLDNVMPLFSVCHESAALGAPVDWGTPTQMPRSTAAIARLGDEIRIPPDLLARPACRVPLEAIRLLRRRLGGQIAVVGKAFGPWTLGYHLFGVESFLLGTLDDPDAVKRAMERLKEVTVAFGRAQLDAGADALCLPDHATRDLCSPAAYRTFLLDTHRELVERLACPIILHICGDTADRIEMIASSGVACFHFDSKVPAATARELADRGSGDGRSVAHPRAAGGQPRGSTALMGGTSNLTIIRAGTPEMIAADVREKRAAGIDILGPECAVPLDAPWRNIKLLADAARQA